VEACAVADEVVEQVQEAAVEVPQRSRRGLIRIVKAVAFVSVIVVVQIVVASMLAPSVQDTTRIAQEMAAASAGKSTKKSDDHNADGGAQTVDEQNLREVELGTYNITRYNPATNTTLAIDFELFGTVLADDVTEFQHRFENSNARIREQVTMTMHAAESADLTDAGLGLLKRQILEKTNRAIGEPLLKEVLFSKFNFVER
jgi:flagellar basal body-associated protein FliL